MPILYTSNYMLGHVWKISTWPMQNLEIFSNLEMADAA
jgi:hypothetical protein